MKHDVAVYYDERMLGHHPTGWDPDHPEWTEAVQALLAEQYPEREPEAFSHPERPERVSVIRDRLLASSPPGLVWPAFEPADSAALRRVHTGDYIDFINSRNGRSGWLSVDTTAISPESVRAARLAAGAGIAAVDAVMDGGMRRAFCLVRPPGHHALPDRAMGFCLFNNVSVAAAHALAAHKCRRILIFDWDLHHGNGTQEIFYDSDSVLYIDTHCAPPFYPGTGLIEETGRGDGAGLTINVPMSAQSGNTAFLAALDRIVAPAAELYQPELILVSAGFDPHHLDQIMTVDEAGFGQLAARIVQLADRHCDGRVVLMLEGGYHAEALAGGAEACVRAMAGEATDDVEQDDNDPGLVAVEEAAAFHGLPGRSPDTATS